MVSGSFVWVLWKKDEGQRRGRNEEANRYLSEGEHVHEVVEEEEPGLDWCLLTSPQATFIQKSRSGGRGVSSNRKPKMICFLLETNVLAVVYAYYPSTKLLYDYKERLLIHF